MLKGFDLVFCFTFYLKALVILGLFFTPFKIAYANEQSVVLNEILANPLTTDEKEWAEIYNLADEPVDLTDWVISENTSTGEINSYPLPKFILPGKSLCFYEFSSSVLNNDKDTVSIFNSNKDRIDSYSYINTAKGKTFSRVPDGETWTLNTNPSKSSISCNDLKVIVTPTATPTPTVVPSPTPATTQVEPTKAEVINEFSITKNIAELEDTKEIKISINLKLSNSPNKIFYLKAAFKKDTSSNYFGLTKNGDNWIKNGEDFSKQILITTDETGSWQKEIIGKVDTEDSGYSGDGEYLLKVAKYTQTGTLSWSNELKIKIIRNNTEVTPTPTIEVLEEIFDQDSTPSSNVKRVRKISLLGFTQNNTLGEATESSNLFKSKDNKSPKITIIFVVIGGIVIFSAVFMFIKNRNII